MVRPNLIQRRTDLKRFGPNLAELGPHSAKFGPALAELGKLVRFWSELGPLRAALVDFDQVRAMVSHFPLALCLIWSFPDSFDRFRPNFRRLRASLPDFDQICSSSTTLWPNLSNLDEIWAGIRPHSVKLGPRSRKEIWSGIIIA